ncbi:MAG: hypothetical protein AB7O49_19675 [Sphingomonadales bacterium]
MPEQDPHDVREDGAADARLAADALRRRLLKTGAVAVPVIISLQSGTAWALSSCASERKGNGKPLNPRPSESTLVSEFGDFKDDPTYTQQRNRQTVTSLTGIPEKKTGQGRKNDIESIVKDFTGSGAGSPYPEGPGESVETGDMIHLMVTNGSCWVSYCNGPIKGSRAVTIFSDTTPSVCK